MSSVILKLFIFVTIFLTIFAPANLMPIKIALVFILLLFSIFSILKNQFKSSIDKGVLIWFLVYISMGAVYMFLGVANNNPDPTNFITLNIITPIIYLIFTIAIINRDDLLKWIFDLFIITAVFVMIYNISFYVVISVPQLNEFRKFFPFIYENFGGLFFGNVRITGENITYLFFVVPIVICKYLIDKNKNITNLLILLLAVANSLLFFRTVFFIVIVLTPIIIFIISKIKDIYVSKQNFFTLLFFVCLSFLYLSVSINFNFQIVYRRIIMSLSGTSITNEFGIIDSGGTIRIEQMYYLFNTWTMKPLFGWGDAAIAIDLERSGTTGIYELSYLAILMQRGLIGFTIYISQLLWIIISLLKISKKKHHLSKIAFPLSIGFIGFLIANATNPYLYSFDRMLILFFPLIIINTYQLSRPKLIN